MKNLIIILLITITSCAWLKANEVALGEDQLQLVGCVVASILAGNPIEGVACGVTDAEQIASIAEAAQVTPKDSPAWQAHKKHKHHKTDGGVDAGD